MNSNAQVQVWALHGLSLIADTGGPMFRSYVRPTLDLVGELLLTESLDKVEVHQCLGNLLTALITSLGPDLQVTFTFTWGTCLLPSSRPFSPQIITITYKTSSMYLCRWRAVV